MPVIQLDNHPQLLASSLTKQTIQLTTREENDDTGGIKESTKLGIVIGLICFFSLIISFWFIWRWHWSKRAPPSEWDSFNNETLNRWLKNVGGGSSRNAASRDVTSDRASRRESTSTVSTLTVQKYPFHQMGYELNSPTAITKPSPVYHNFQ